MLHQGSSMAPFRCVPAHSHWFEVVEDKHLEEDTANKLWTVYVTHLVASTTLLQDKVVEEDILEEAEKAAVGEHVLPDPTLPASVKRPNLRESLVEEEKQTHFPERTLVHIALWRQHLLNTPSSERCCLCLNVESHLNPRQMGPQVTCDEGVL